MMKRPIRDNLYAVGYGSLKCRVCGEVFPDRIGVKLCDCPESLPAQVKHLADMILHEIPGEPSESESAVECAIRIIREQREAIEGAYRERNQLVAFLSKRYPSHLAEDSDLPEDQRTKWPVVCIHTPVGQLTWHVQNLSVMLYFSHLKFQDNDWDGHTTEEKYSRLEKLGIYQPHFFDNVPTLRETKPDWFDESGLA